MGSRETELMLKGPPDKAGFSLFPPADSWRDAAISFYRSWIETILTSTRRRSTNAPEAELRIFEDVSGRNDAHPALGIAPA